MFPQSSRLNRLRSGTRDAHASVETVPALARLLSPDLTVPEYIVILQHMHALHAHLEPMAAVALEALPAAAAMLDGTRPSALAEDLTWFCVSPIMPPKLPSFASPAEALGALYVIEGSGLGGRIIGRHLAGTLGVANGAGGSFYCGLDAETARRRFGRLADVLELPLPAQSDAAEAATVDDRVVAGALETFRTLERWLRQIGNATEGRRVMAGAVAS